MGMNTILMLIAGIVMSTMVASQVAPSIVEGVKVKKTQVQTINNQEVIFEAIKRYTTIKQVAPTSIQDLIDAGYLEANVNNNGFGEEYTINVDKALGVATITTTIEDPKVQETFLNSFTSMSKPICTGTIVDGVCSSNEFKTTFVIPNEVMHGNALLMTGIPIQNTAPDSNINKYWYDTSSGKATLKIFDGTNWVEVNLGGSGDDSTNVKLTGDQTIDGIKTFTSFPITPSSEPTSDYQVANKKYVDDKIGHTQNLSDNGWTKLPNGLILQWGKYNGGLLAGTINFPIIFTTKVFSINTTSTYGGGAATATINNLTKKDFVFINRFGSGGSSYSDFYWFAIGY
ncbi:hypothetical protein HOO31_07835 [Aliarcobacter cryaerophilus]|uniref:gp53-like domain-containing protein n=1 Tax=Aliarcobacter cryaerophilus TaxID=28198 RepID=UPI00164A527B|nr:hypothetical protein [Aliarcobacter cryaerophilus]QNK84552.1 hypothetical protein HOO31_07835 [Aliarcobacter cryaerophilus]